MNLSNSIYSGINGWSKLQEIVREYHSSGIYILVDENTETHCLPVLLEKCTSLSGFPIIKLQSGESNKTLTGLEKVWRMLSSGQARRNSLLICLGGGVISDIGGFAAATFKRGMNFIHIPTTLLAMVDASIGGKTGINLDSVKNQIGIFAQPKGVFVFTEFLNTLPERQKLSGYAEMIKHALIDSEQHFGELLLMNSPDKFCTENAVLTSASVKIKVVNQDPSEGGIRKVLNFGHTIGHAIESYSQQNDSDPLVHGEAIAIGIICESYISMRFCGLAPKDLETLTHLVMQHFPHYAISKNSVTELLALMRHDKKNTDKDTLNFSLIRKIGEPVFDQFPEEILIRESLHFYTNLEIGFPV